MGKVHAIARPVLAVVSGVGWLMLALGVAAAWAGWQYGWREVWLLGLVLGVCLLLALGFIVGRSAYRVQVDLAATRVVVGTRATGRVVVANAGSRTLLPSRIELPVGAGLAAFPVPRLRRDQEHEDLFVIPTSRRGVVQVGPVSSVRDDPLRLLRREVRWTDAQDLYVHPRTVGLEGSSAGFLRDMEGLPTRDLSSSDVSFHALREYTQGDDRRSVHWRTTARTGRLMVRQFEETRRSHLVVALSVDPTDYADVEEFELAVSCAASLALQAIREEKPVTVMTQAGTVASATGQRLLDGMSLVNLADAGATITDLARGAAAAVPGASAMGVVGGSLTTASTWQQVSVYVPLGARGFGLASRSGTTPTRRSIGGFAVVGLGDLPDLPRVMRRLEA